MSTIAEVESAAARLSIEEQEQLLRGLTQRLRLAGIEHSNPESPREWMARLERLRISIGTGGHAVTGEQLLEELREERN